MVSKVVEHLHSPLLPHELRLQRITKNIVLQRLTTFLVHFFFHHLFDLSFDGTVAAVDCCSSHRLSVTLSEKTMFVFLSPNATALR